MLTQRRWIGVALVAVLISAFTFAPRRVESVAVMVQFTGKVEVQRPNAKPMAATVGLALLPGDKVVVPAGGKAVFMYRTGQLQTASAAVTIAEPAKKEQGALYERTLSTITKVAATDAAKQPNRQGMIRPVDGAATPISPRNSLLVLDVRPQLTWFRVPAATSYTVQIRRFVDGAMPVRFQASADTVWSYPADAPPLVPGATYEWTVGAAGGRPGTLQKFRIVSAEDFQRIASTMQELQQAGIDPASDGLFILALAYRDAGLMYEADAALERMQKSGQGAGRTYHLLRGDVLNALGDLDGASREFIAADAESGA